MGSQAAVVAGSRKKKLSRLTAKTAQSDPGEKGHREHGCQR